MRWLTLPLIGLLTVGLVQAQPATDKSSEHKDKKENSIATIPVEGEYINPSPSSFQLNESSLVSQGPGNMNRDFLTGSVTSFSNLDINQSGYNNIQEFLRGRVAGLQITRTGMNTYRLRIRGGMSLVLKDEPLVVIDGMPMHSTDVLSAINPGDIKNVSVLKGPETAIYGSRGANGVIVVNTH